MSNEVKTKEKVDMDPKYITTLTVTLLVTCLIVAALLGLVNGVTAGPIAEINQQKTEQAMLAVVAAYSVLNFTVQSVIQPKFTGESVGVTPTIISMVP